MKKKLVTILLTLSLVFSFMPAVTFTAFAESGLYDGKIVVLHSNDVHGQIDGYQYMAGLKAKYKALGADVILADAGDYSQGSIYVSDSKGASAVELMNAAGYDVATLGNHEFDYGYEQLVKNLKAANFKVVCANVLYNDKQAFPGTVVIEKGGVKIGFFGIDTPKAQTTVNPAIIKGVEFLGGEEFEKCIKDQIDALKEAKADIIIGLTHLGVDAESVPYRTDEVFKDAAAMGVDILIDGHSHTVMTEGEKEEPIQSTGTKFANIGVVVIDKETKTIIRNKLVDLKDKKDHYYKDLIVDKNVKTVSQRITDAVDAEYGQVFATSDVTLNGEKAANPEKGIVNGNRDGETNNGDLITDAMLWSVKKTDGIKDVDDDHIVAINNGGGIRAAIEPGDVTKAMIKTVMPYGNTVAVAYVSGETLLEALEASTFCTPEAVGGFPQIAGMKIVINTAPKYDANDSTYPGSTYYGPKTINRVAIESVNGRPFNPNDKYAVITNNFCTSGGDTYYAFASAETKFDTGITDAEAVMDYITTELGGVIGQQYAEPQGRIAIVNVALAKPKLKIKAAKKKFTANWAKVKNADGYAVQYDKNKNFNNAKTVIVKANKATVKKLKAGKYYVKVRASKTVTGVRCYSSWSKAQTVKVK